MAGESTTKRVTVILAGSSAGLEKTFAEASAAADVSSKKMAGAFDEGTSKVGNSFSKLGSMFAGVPLIGGSLEKMGAQFENAESKSAKFGSVLASVGKIAAVAGVAGFAAVAVESVKMAQSFQSSMELIHTQAGASQAEVAKMSSAILTLAGPTAQAPDELAAALYHVESTGVRGAAALNEVKVAAQGATTGHANLEDVTNALNATIASGIPGVQNMSQAMGALNAIVGAGDMKMQDLSDAMGTGVLAVVKGYGLSLNDVGAAMATFGDNNIRGANAATYLRTAVQAFAVPAKSGAAALKELGITQGELAKDMASGGLNKAIEDLHQKLVATGHSGNDMGEILTAAFGKKAGPGVQVLMGQFDRFESKVGEVNAGAKNFGSDFQATTQTLAFQMSSLRDSVDALGIKFGMWLIPKLEMAGAELAKLIGWFEKHTTVVKVFGGIILAALVPALVAAAASAVAAAAPFLAIGAAIAGVAYGIDWLIKRFHLMPDIKQWGADIEKVIGAIPQAFNALKEAFDHTLEFPSNQYSGIGKAFVEVGFIARDVFDVVKRIPGALEHAFQNTEHAFDNVVHAFQNLWHALQNFGNAMMDAYRAVAHAVENIIHAFSNMVTFVEAIPGFFAALPGRIMAELDALPGQLLNLFEQGFEWAIAAFVAFNIKAVEFFASLPGKLLDAVVTFGPGIVEWMGKALWATAGAAASGAESAVKFFASIPGKLLAAVVDFGPKIAAWMADAFVSLAQVAFDGMTSVTRFFLSIPGRIVTALGDATKWLFSVGQDVISGLIKGMEDIIPKVAQTAEHIASGIKNKVEGLLGIHSPSTVFAEIGSNIVAGLAQGINTNSGAATSASSKLVSAAHAGAFGGNAAGTSSQAKQPLYITVQVAGKNVGQAILQDLYALQRSGTPVAITRNGRPIGAT